MDASLVQEQPIQGEDDIEVVQYKTRDDVLRACFRHIDADNSGFLEMSEIRGVMTSRTPTQNLIAARSFLEWLDANEDDVVDLDEFLAAKHAPELEELSEEEFVELFRALMTDEKPAYVHPSANREYLESAVAPVLRRGLEELLKVVEQDRLSVAAGEPWDSEGYLPEEYLPFQSLRWLGNWLLGPAKLVDEKRTPRSGPKNFRDLSREEQLLLVFRHVDKDDNGYLSFDEVMGLVSFLDTTASEKEAREFFRSFDLDEEQLLSATEFVPRMKKLLESHASTDSDFVFHCMRILGASHLREFTRKDKLKMCFAHIDVDKSGELSPDEFTRISSALTSDEAAELVSKTAAELEEAQKAYDDALAGTNEKRTAKKLKKLDKARKEHEKANKQLSRANEAAEQVATAFQRLDVDQSGMIDENEFLSMMLKITQEFPDDIFDMGVARLLGKNPVDDDNDPMIDMTPRYAEYVRNIYTHKLVKHISPAKLKQISESENEHVVFLVDARTKAEQMVSCIEGAIKVVVEVSESGSPDGSLAGGSAALFSATGAGLVLANRAAVRSTIESHIFSQEGKNVIVVCYDTCGLRGGLVAQMLHEDGLDIARNGERDDIQVFNLCGGIVEWYNRGNDVVNLSNQPVELLHPGAYRIEEFVTRPNSFKLPKRRGRKAKAQGGGADAPALGATHASSSDA